MADIPLERLRALELRYDGPIPAQHFDNDGAARRRLRGVIAVLESQAADFLQAAARCQVEIEELAVADSIPRAPTAVADGRSAVLRDRFANHIRQAAEALREATRLRRELALEPHPLVGVSVLLAAA